MQTISYSTLRDRLASMFDKVNDDHAPVLITRENGSSAVLMSLEDFHALEETVYLFDSLANAQRLHRSIQDVEAGKTTQHGLIDA